MKNTTDITTPQTAGAPGSARWEHGYRCHGLWIGTKRLARVSIGHRGVRHDGAHPYSWEIDVAPFTAGRAKNLKEGKRAAETALQAARLLAEERIAHAKRIQKFWFHDVPVACGQAPDTLPPNNRTVASAADGDQ